MVVWHIHTYGLSLDLAAILKKRSDQLQPILHYAQKDRVPRDSDILHGKSTRCLWDSLYVPKNNHLSTEREYGPGVFCGGNESSIIGQS